MTTTTTTDPQSGPSRDSKTRANSIPEFRDIVSRSFVPLTVSGASDRPFAAQVSTSSADRAVFTTLKTQPHLVERTPTTIAAGGSGYFKLNMLLSGSGVLVQDGREVLIRPGDLALYDTSRPYSLMFDDVVSNLVMMFPKDQLSLPATVVEQLTAVSLGGDSALGSIVTKLLEQIPSTITALPLHTRRQVAQSGLELLEALLSTTLGTDSGTPDPRQSQLETVYRFIDANLADDLTPSSIAAAHFMSTRHLHDLFTDTDTTVSALIRDKRLERCRSDILDPALFSRTIASLAAANGFPDPAHFSRVFRARFGTSPSELRQSVSG
ncbi:helix-turn-helix domain-containing protein [Brevibacterium permense]|uniref:AraC-like ligand-binding domain-containing protein n=1 Tax=Brevibacterium permense TaxID=234834 RepID=UPI0021CEB6EE|nr:helix-turn-helix domain-containing protein [Brevibacterium permense]MCU4299053.1 helix-turn-helix domain-containing protein [Brevibacterium permense]